MSSIATTYRGFLMTLDPVHIGSGGYRLARVDLPVIRESGTNLPKIPGTSLSGAARAYAALLSGRTSGEVRCAGQRKHCGACQVCVAFGSIRKKDEQELDKPSELAYAGMVNIFDARLVFFPIFSMAGPIWITGRTAFGEAGFDSVADDAGPDVALITWDWPLARINLGWILLPTKRVQVPNVSLGSEWNVIKDRLVILPDPVFSHIAGSNLEVRTSVSIDPETGAAKSGALFTYEAIPRAAWLRLEIVEHQYRDFPAGNWKSPIEVVRSGLELASTLGIGGMGTRGFGRIRLIALQPEGGEQ
jgi:CRISPR-associated protein Cmr4